MQQFYKIDVINMTTSSVSYYMYHYIFISNIFCYQIICHFIITNYINVTLIYLL